MRARAEGLVRAGFDAVAIKPSERPVSTLHGASFEAVLVDYEGRDHLPAPAEVAAFAGKVRLTAPLRADGFDPLGDDALLRRYEPHAAFAVVAGHPAFLTDAERERPVAPRLRAALTRHPSAWVGTEGMARMARRTGATQYLLYSRASLDHVRRLIEAGYPGGIALYTPTVITDDEDVALDALGAYVARRRPVATRLPDGAPPDATATGEARRTLLRAIDSYAMVGSRASIAARIDQVRSAGVDHVVAYPARADRDR